MRSVTTHQRNAPWRTLLHPPSCPTHNYCGYKTGIPVTPSNSVRLPSKYPSFLGLPSMQDSHKTHYVSPQHALCHELCRGGPNNSLEVRVGSSPFSVNQLRLVPPRPRPPLLPNMMFDASVICAWSIPSPVTSSQSSTFSARPLPPVTAKC